MNGANGERTMDEKGVSSKSLSNGTAVYQRAHEIPVAPRQPHGEPTGSDQIVERYGKIKLRNVLSARETSAGDGRVGNGRRVFAFVSPCRRPRPPFRLRDGRTQRNGTVHDSGILIKTNFVRENVIIVFAAESRLLVACAVQ